MKKIKAYGLVPYKIEKNDIKILLCKSISSKNKWGCIKGMQDGGESSIQCAIREVKEESSLCIEQKLFEDYFEQKNINKDIGVWLVNSKNIKNFDDYFYEEKLKSNFLSWENSKIKFFSIYDLPLIKKKQIKLLKEIKGFLKNR